MDDKKPVHTISHGNVRACIWRNDSATRLFHDVTFFRSYRKNEGWATSCSFGAKELPVLAMVILDAHTWIHKQLTGQGETPAAPAQAPDPVPVNAETTGAATPPG